MLLNIDYVINRIVIYFSLGHHEDIAETLRVLRTKQP